MTTVFGTSRAGQNRRLPRCSDLLLSGDKRTLRGYRNSVVRDPYRRLAARLRCNAAYRACNYPIRRSRLSHTNRKRFHATFYLNTKFSWRKLRHRRTTYSEPDRDARPQRSRDSFTMKHAGVSSTDHGGGKRRHAVASYSKSRPPHREDFHRRPRRAQSGDHKSGK